MAKKERILGELRTCQPIDYKESAIRKALEEDAQLLVETKHDGVQLNIVVKPVQGQAGKDWEVYFLSREGLQFDTLALKGVATELQKLLAIYGASTYNGYRGGFMIQGELYSETLTAAQVAGVLRKKEPKDSIALIFSAFAVVPFTHVIGNTEPIQVNRMMQNRYALTLLWGLQQIAGQAIHIDPRKDLFKITLDVVKQSVVYRIEPEPLSKDGLSIPSLMEAYEGARAAGHEGVVVWRINQPWHRGKKSGGWKMKPNETFDGHIVGFTAGKVESTEDLIIGFQVCLEDGHVVNVDGLTDDLIQKVTHSPDEYMGMAVEVSCMERFENGSLRHPKFAGFRGINDKLIKE